jgi:hypothetical protein
MGFMPVQLCNYVMKHAVRLRLHNNLPVDVHEKIHEGLRCCEEYFNDPKEVPGETYRTMARFVKNYSKERIKFCDSYLNDFAVRVVNDTYQMAKIRSVPFSKDFPLAVKDLEDYGDYSPIVAQGLRCEFCFGHLYFNSVNRDTGVQFQWIEIARALKRRAKSLLPDHLWEGLSIVDEDVTPGKGHVDMAIASSLLEAAKAIGVDQDAMVWQVLKYADQKAHVGPKELIRSADWVGLATHTHNARIMLDAMWRGPIYLKDRHREAARTMAIAVALVQHTWFNYVAASEGPFFKHSKYEVCYYPGPMRLERGEFPHSMFSPGVALFDPALIFNEDHSSSCAIDMRAPNASKYSTADERWIGDMSMFDPHQVSDYCLPPNETITQRRVETIKMILNAKFKGSEDKDGDWHDLWKFDLGVTGLMALRSPMLYDDKFLRDLMSIAGDDEERLMRMNDVARVPGRGLVSLKGMDGLFSSDTLFHSDDFQNVIATIVERLRKFEDWGLEFSIDSEPVEETLILSDNPGAIILLNAMSYIMHHTDELESQLGINDLTAWTDLTIALRRATDAPTTVMYTQKLCKELVQLAGLSMERLNEEGWSRHRRTGILPVGLPEVAQCD